MLFDWVEAKSIRLEGLLSDKEQSQPPLGVHLAPPSDDLSLVILSMSTLGQCCTTGAVGGGKEEEGISRLAVRMC